MPFRSYQIAPSPEGPDIFFLSEPLPLRLSGPAGLIAGHVRALTAETRELAWTLSDDKLLALAATPATPPRWVFFEQTEHNPERIDLSRVLSLRGLSAIHTELLVSFAPLEVLKTGSGLCVRVPSGARQWREELALNGGVLNPKGPWTWCDRALNIGSTVVG
jgi:hypothetical protein